MTSIGDIYGKMLNTVRTIKESAKPLDGDNSLKGSGPNVSGFNKPINDKKKPKKSCDCTNKCACGEEDNEEEMKLSKRDKLTKKLKNPILSEKTRKELKSQLQTMSDKQSEEIQESKKIATKILNKHMSKLVFDQLYNKVLKENFGQPREEEENKGLGALGLDDSTSDSAMGDDEDFDKPREATEEDSVTFTLDRATAEKLLDVIGAAMGEESEDEGEGDDEMMDFGDDDEDDYDYDEGDMDFDEDEEVQGTKVAPDKKGVFQKHSNKVGGTLNPKGGNKAKTDVTDAADVGTSHTAPSYTALQGKNNQVPGSTIKQGQNYFR